MSFDNTSLILIPCCKSKSGNAQIMNCQRISDFISPEMSQLLEEGRRLSFRHPRVCVNEESPLVPALDLYTGHLYQADGFRESLVKALKAGTHCLIISGGYGLVRAEEPIHWYEASMSTTAPIWRTRLYRILRDYLMRNRIGTVFAACSGQYFRVLRASQWARHAERVYCYVPRVPRGQGNAYREVPTRIGLEVRDLIDRGMAADTPWMPLKPSRFGC